MRHALPLLVTLVLVATLPAAARGAAPRVVSLTPARDVSFPFWCDWGYDWDERCYRDDSDRLPIGGDDDKVWRAGLQFALGTIPSGSDVLRAELRVYFDRTCLGPRLTSRPCSGRGYTLDVAPIWSADWFHEREVELGPVFARTVLPAFAGPGWVAWDVSDLVWSWAAGDEPNDGLLLKLADEEEDFGVGGPKVPSMSFREPSVRPRLEVTFLPPE